MEITATEIERQAGKLDEKIDTSYSSINVIIKSLDAIEKTVSSDDSNLALTIRQYMNSYSTMQANLKNNFSSLATLMHNYAAKTLANEEEASSSVREAQQQLEEIKDNGELQYIKKQSFGPSLAESAAFKEFAEKASKAKLSSNDGEIHVDFD